MSQNAQLRDMWKDGDFGGMLLDKYRSSSQRSSVHNGDTAWCDTERMCIKHRTACLHLCVFLSYVRERGSLKMHDDDDDA
jgi:hypothetical protein